MNASKENIEVETRLHSTLANETQLSDTLHGIRNNDEQLLRDNDNRLINDNSYYAIRENDDVFPIENNSIWITDNRKHRKKYNGINNDGKDEISLNNKFHVLYVESDDDELIVNDVPLLHNHEVKR